MNSPSPVLTMPCRECGQPVVIKDIQHYKRCMARGGRVFHNPCRYVMLARQSSARMTKRNPMRHLKIRMKMASTLRRIGHKPPVQGGNGRPMPRPQRLLWEALGEGWFSELKVLPGLGRGRSGYPTNYKIDIGNPLKMIAIEVDGPGHYHTKVRDEKKTKFLEGRGWKVLRFTNRQVTADLKAVVNMIMFTT